MPMSKHPALCINVGLPSVTMQASCALSQVHMELQLFSPSMQVCADWSVFQPRLQVSDSLVSIWLQIQRPHRGRRTCGPAQILTGPITLAKHPVSHRGDTRQVIAVNPAGRPAGLDLIGDYTNVIVFSQHGHRPLPSKLAGADLVRSGAPR